MLASCALYFEAQSSSKFVRVAHLSVLEESCICLSVKAVFDSDMNFLVQISKAAILLQSPVFLEPQFLTEHVEVNNLSGRIGEQIVDVPVADTFEKVCRGLEVKPAVTHLSESTSSCRCAGVFLKPLRVLFLLEDRRVNL